MLIAVYKNKFLVLFVIIFGTLSFAVQPHDPVSLSGDSFQGRECDQRRGRPEQKERKNRSSV